mmetsp:Transcript_7581/g.28576  ORF Transcript_7581/g.28576 Transcript_7581/m.28576 type:complete len:395 (+) Transcript_7581:1253-2437(+)
MRGACARPLGVRKHVGELEARVSHDLQRVEMLRLRLATESADGVRREGNPRNAAAGVANQLHERFLGVAASHAVQHRATARLQREVQALADVRALGDEVQQLRREVLGMRGRESKPHVGRSERASVQQLREAHPSTVAQAVGVAEARIRRRVRRQRVGPALVVVAIHVLPEERDLLDAQLLQLAHFVHNRRRGSRSLPAPRERNNAEAAHVVAAAHDADEGAELRIRLPSSSGLGAILRHADPDRRHVRIRLLQAELHVHGLIAALHNVQQPRQVSIGIRPHDQVDQPLLLQQFILEALSHAAKYTHIGLCGQESRLHHLHLRRRRRRRFCQVRSWHCFPWRCSLLPVTTASLTAQLLQAGPHLPLRSVSHRARVEQHEVCVLRIRHVLMAGAA